MVWFVTDWDKQLRTIKEIGEELGEKYTRNCTIVIYNTIRGKVFGVREPGYRFANRLWKDEDLFPCMMYDSRVDDYTQEEEDFAKELLDLKPELVKL